ncbi:MAG TPA: methyltransferase [Gaiellaceae bacterium]|nr:methyltransferase [Gaiellaceae bacterium]
MPHRPMMSAERARRIRAWQDDVFDKERARTEETTVEYLGLTLRIAPDVQPITGMSDLLGWAVLAEVRETDRVLDMGTGSGVNAILASSKAADVVAVDINPHAVAAARANAALNGAADRIVVVEGDLFDAVEGRFDLVIFDPPFRWFAPRDLRERNTTDEDYRTLTAFFRQVPERLTADGRILLFFGTSGDADFLDELIRESGLTVEKVASRDLEKDGLEVEYFTYRLTP